MPKIALTLTAAMMAQIPVGKKQKRVAITAGTVQSRSGTLTITGAGWNPPAVYKKKGIILSSITINLSRGLLPVY